VPGIDDRSGDETVPTQLAELPAAELRVLAALAVVGRASLSAAELAEVAAIEDIPPLVSDLERRGLISRHEETQRYSALDHVGAELRRTDADLATGERLLQYMTSLAKGGRMTPARLLDDAEAVLGLTEWAAERRQWQGLLELVKTLQACFALVEHVEEWLTLLDRALKAARALHDRQSEVWVLQQLATVSASIGDRSAAHRYRREAEELSSRRHHSTPPRGDGDSDPQPTNGQGQSQSQSQATFGGAGTLGERGARRVALWILCLSAAAAGGIGAGYAIGYSNANGHTTTTVTLGGHTVTTGKTVTLPPTTVLSTTTVTLPARTVFTTETVTTGISTQAE
jgi:hypothetical protein